MPNIRKVHQQCGFNPQFLLNSPMLPVPSIATNPHHRLSMSAAPSRAHLWHCIAPRTAEDLSMPFQVPQIQNRPFQLAHCLEVDLLQFSPLIQLSWIPTLSPNIEVYSAPPWKNQQHSHDPRFPQPTLPKGFVFENPDPSRFSLFRSFLYHNACHRAPQNGDPLGYRLQTYERSYGVWYFIWPLT